MGETLDSVGRVADVGSIRSESLLDLASLVGAKLSVAGAAEVATLFWRLRGVAFTGTATFKQDDVERQVVFRGGAPVFGSSTSVLDRMASQLYREGRITAEQRDESVEIARGDGVRMGRALISVGALDEEELAAAVNRHIGWIIYSLFSWGRAQVTFDPDYREREPIVLKQDPCSILFEGVRRKMGLRELEEALGRPETATFASAVRLSEDVLDSTGLDNLELRFVRALSSGKSVASLCSVYGLDLLTGMQLAFATSVIAGARPVFSPRPSEPMERRPAFLLNAWRFESKLSQVRFGDHFSVLGVRRDASSFEIERAYQELSLEYDEEWVPASVKERFELEIGDVRAAVERSYQLLQDADTRAAYLKNLRD